MNFSKIFFYVIILNFFQATAVFDIDSFVDNFEKENFEIKFKVFRRAERNKALKDKKEKKDRFKNFITCSKKHK